ncbi:hypothetical protein Tco_1238163 [Tanacetum coccineum]
MALLSIKKDSGLLHTNPKYSKWSSGRMDKITMDSTSPRCILRQRKLGWNDYDLGLFDLDELVQETTKKVLVFDKWKKLKMRGIVKKQLCDNRDVSQIDGSRLENRVVIKGFRLESVLRFGTKVNSHEYLVDANLHVPLEEIKIDKTLHFVEEPVEIMDREVRSLKRVKLHFVKSAAGNSRR